MFRWDKNAWCATNSTSQNIQVCCMCATAHLCILLCVIVPELGVLKIAVRYAENRTQYMRCVVVCYRTRAPQKTRPVQTVHQTYQTLEIHDGTWVTSWKEPALPLSELWQLSSPSQKHLSFLNYISSSSFLRVSLRYHIFILKRSFYASTKQHNSPNSP